MPRQRGEPPSITHNTGGSAPKPRAPRRQPFNGGTPRDTAPIGYERPRTRALGTTNALLEYTARLAGTFSAGNATDERHCHVLGLYREETKVVRNAQRRVVGFVAAALLATAGAVSAAGPAFAHTGVTIEPARAGAKNAVASVNAEAESDSAGVTKVQIFLPVGITPADISQISVPKQWKLTKQDDSYTVEGPALAVGRSAEHKVRIRQLPTYASISFKVLQTYSDGKTDRWIGLPSANEPEPENPAPTVKLAGGSGTAPASAPATAAPSPSVEAPASDPVTPSTSVAAAPAIEPASDSEGPSAWWWIAGGVLVALLAGSAVTIARRRRPST
ncbi:hypothetical protein DMB66_07355 [Actinoplanes sp. ATCC 53533]|uniref:DUF1775 domain-containing protein n=1 Tax=Actinoplanes sp. ATCC 53533 TaxID=1288362 RepID=UPI000F7723B0|nr:DUF1775 domain-containing protein [Actinoplanes sp. ATCC 53533]RSM71650.1 hypothetical protein DMB66_07355 [Actinoplanes sp. ATCC 53533]